MIGFFSGTLRPFFQDQPDDFLLWKNIEGPLDIHFGGMARLDHKDDCIDKRGKGQCVCTAQDGRHIKKTYRSAYRSLIS